MCHGRVLSRSSNARFISRSFQPAGLYRSKTFSLFLEFRPFLLPAGVARTEDSKENQSHSYEAYGSTGPVLIFTWSSQGSRRHWSSTTFHWFMKDLFSLAEWGYLLFVARQLRLQGKSFYTWTGSRPGLDHSSTVDTTCVEQFSFSSPPTAATRGCVHGLSDGTHYIIDKTSPHPATTKTPVRCGCLPYLGISQSPAWFRAKVGNRFAPVSRWLQGGLKLRWATHDYRYD